MIFKERDEKIENLQNQITRTCKQNKVLEDTHKTLLFEIAEFNNALSALHNSISRLEDYEVEKKFLASEKKKLEDYIDELKKLHQKELEKLKDEIEQIKLNYKKETETELIQMQSKASAKHENYLNIIKEKDSLIVKLENEISRIKNEKDQDVLKIKIEYEEKLNKIKVKLEKNKVSRPLQDSFKNDDIFRQKYIKIEKESKAEIAQLKKQIEELQSQVLKSHSNSDIHHVLLKNTSIINFETNTEKCSSYEEGYLYCPKRLKYNEDNINADDANAITNKNNDLNARDHSKSDQFTVVKATRKKLFNIDLNYF